MGGAIIWGKTMIDQITIRGSEHFLPGGSGYYASLSASHFSRAYLVSKTGSDFLRSDLEILRSKGVDISHLEVLAGRCNVWRADCTDPNTHITILHDIHTPMPLEQPAVPLPPSGHAFIAEEDPVAQLEMLKQLPPGAMALVDTKKRWARSTPDELIAVIKNAGASMMNREEADLLFGERPVLGHITRLRDLGVKIAVLNQASGGSIISFDSSVISIPALNREPFDTLGGGDTFAGGFIGALAAGESPETAFLYGQVMSSFVVEDLGPQRLFYLTRREIESRLIDAKSKVRIL